MLKIEDSQKESTCLENWVIWWKPHSKKEKFVFQVSRQNCIINMYINCILPIKATFVHVWRRLFSHVNVNNAIFISKHRHSLPFNLTGFCCCSFWKIGESQNLNFFMAYKNVNSVRCDVCDFSLYIALLLYYVLCETVICLNDEHQ